MFNKLLGIIAILTVFSVMMTNAYCQIVVENESAKWEKPILAAGFPDISSRIILEYTTTIYENDLTRPPDFIIPPRIIVEYATAIKKYKFKSIDICEGNFDSDNDVDHFDLDDFGLNYGLESCIECAGDFDNDKDIDGNDLKTMIGDFGRTDCPFFPMIP
jgi:hypothetical protein